MIIHLITSNEGKYREMSRMLDPLGHGVVKENIDYPEIQVENLRDVVEFGVKWIVKNAWKPWMDDPGHGFVIDDSGLFISGLKDFPGVYSKFVYYTIGLDGILELMDGMEEHERRAVFRTALMFHTNGNDHYFEGLSEGTIIREKRGDQGFGYDPIFVPQGSELTFAEMDTDMKNSYSHRGEAINRFMGFLKSK